jgi:excisionase family DNA binding protein
MTNPHTAALPIRSVWLDTTPPDQPRELLRVEEAAARLSIGRTSMFALIRDGVIDSVKVGRLRRVPVDAVTAYINNLVAIQAA